MKFQATEEQILQIGANAVNAAKAMGMGILHYEDRNYTPKDIEENFNTKELYIDYFKGRMNKMYIKRVPDNYWVITDTPPNIAYQSWAHKYSTYEELVNSVIG